MYLDRYPAGRGAFRVTFRVAFAAILAAVLVAGYVVVALVDDITHDDATGLDWPGRGFVVLAAVGIVGLASLVDVLRPGRARRQVDRPDT